MAQDKTNQENARKLSLRTGVIVLGLLGVITFGEFLVAVIAPPWSWALWAAAIWKTIYVVRDYMHIGRLFSEEESH